MSMDSCISEKRVLVGAFCYVDCYDFAKIQWIYSCRLCLSFLFCLPFNIALLLESFLLLYVTITTDDAVVCSAIRKFQHHTC